MPIECLISFDNNPQGVYYAGQELSGVVDLSVDATKRIKGEPPNVYYENGVHDSRGVWVMRSLGISVRCGDSVHLNARRPRANGNIKMYLPPDADSNVLHY